MAQISLRFLRNAPVEDTAETITALLARAESGDAAAESAAVRMVYEELRAVAANQLRRRGSPIGSLTATALVHEAYFRVFRGAGIKPKNRRHLFFVFGQAMWRIIVERHRLKRLPQVAVDLTDLAYPTTTDAELLDLDQALRALADDYPLEYEAAILLKMVGLSLAETADVLDVSVATVKRRWALARAFLARLLLKEEPRHGE